LIKKLYRYLAQKKFKIIKRLNYFLVIIIGKRLQIITIFEYPKCGGTWISNVLRSYLNIEKKYGNYNIIRRNSILQRHELYNPSYNKAIIVVRDPRDVITSYYFHEIYHIKDDRLKSKINFTPNSSDKINLENYIYEKLNNPEKTFPFFSYQAFIESWTDKNNIIFIKYEDFHKSGQKELIRILNFLNIQIDIYNVNKCIEENDFKIISGRIKGFQDKESHVRKGIIGDWKNYFTHNACKILETKQGKFLRLLGYESDDNWVKSVHK